MRSATPELKHTLVVTSHGDAGDAKEYFLIDQHHAGRSVVRSEFSNREPIQVSPS